MWINGLAGARKLRIASNVMNVIRNCREMEAEKKIQNGLKKTKCLTIRTGRQKHEQIEEEVREGKIYEVASYMYSIYPSYLYRNNAKQRVKQRRYLI